MYTFYHSKGYYNVRTGINDPELDGMIEEARSVTDEAQRKDLYRQIATRAMDQGYFLMMPTNPQIRAIRDNVQGVDEGTYNPMRAFTMGVLWKNISKS